MHNGFILRTSAPCATCAAELRLCSLYKSAKIDASGLYEPPLHLWRESRNFFSCAPVAVRCAHLQPGIYRLPNPAQRASTGLRTPLPLRFRACIPVPAHDGVRGEGVGTRVALRKHDGEGEIPRWTGDCGRQAEPLARVGSGERSPVDPMKAHPSAVLGRWHFQETTLNPAQLSSNAGTTKTTPRLFSV